MSWGGTPGESRRFPTQFAPAPKLDEARRAAREGLPFPNERLTVGQFLDWWVADHLPGRVGPRTLPSYEQKARHISRILGR